jgi:hypothetical protein
LYTAGHLHAATEDGKQIFLELLQHSSIQIRIEKLDRYGMTASNAASREEKLQGITIIIIEVTASRRLTRFEDAALLGFGAPPSPIASMSQLTYIE